MAKEKESLSHLTLTAIEAALMAGDLLRQGFGTHFSISSKEGRHNLVTEYDYKSEKAIISFLTDNVPSSQFMAEESGATGVGSVLWVIDPLDGTVNFAHQIPVFSVSIAAVVDHEIVCGVVYQPMTHELFVAEKGKGAFLNGKKISVSAVETLEGAMLATGLPYNLAQNPHHCIEHFTDFLRLGVPLRRLGSAAIDLAYLAAGRFDGFFEAYLYPWDFAAGLLLVEEAGGSFSTWDGEKIPLLKANSLCASNKHLQTAMLKILQKKVGK